ncbi:MAG: prolyl oligopeptidase family serine peptidase, partial [Devosia sp.]
LVWDLERGAVLREIAPPALATPSRRTIPGQLDDLALTIDGKRVFVRRSGETFVFDVESGGLVKTISGGLVAASQDGARVLVHDKDGARTVLWEVGANREIATLPFRVEHAVFATNGRAIYAATDKEIVLLKETGAITSRWAADATRLAITRDGSRLVTSSKAVSVWDPAGPKLVRTFAGARRVPISAAWSPDGRRLAFRREPADSPGMDRNSWERTSCGIYRYCGPFVSKQPWAIWVVELNDPRSRKIWQAAPGAGSVYYGLDQSLSPGQHGDELFWSVNDWVGFVWERDGWRHLYAVPASGGKAIRLTPGDGEVETAALSLDRKHIVYATNIGDLERRHISMVGFDGAPPTPLTRGEASQWSPTPLAGGRVAYIGAGWAEPPRVRVREAGGATETVALPEVPATFPAALLVKPQSVEFAAADGQKAFGHLFVPAQSKGCAIIFSHGGIRRQMLPGFHYMDAYQYLYEMNQYLASRGCVVLSVEYRSSIMRGEAFRNAPGWGFAGNSELLDFVGAAKYLMARKDVDARRGVGIYGLSWGGYMTAEALAQHSDLFKVGFDMAGVHTAPDPLGYAHSAIGHLSTWTSPVFVVHGDDDLNVDINESIALARALQIQRPQVELKQRVVPGQTHDLYQTYEQLVEIYTEGSDFLLERLGTR